MKTYQGIESATGEMLEGNFPIAELQSIDEVMDNAKQAFIAYQSVSNEQKSEFLIGVLIYPYWLYIDTL